jgi:hypothetical protein
LGKEECTDEVIEKSTDFRCWPILLKKSKILPRQNSRKSLPAGDFDGGEDFFNGIGQKREMRGLPQADRSHRRLSGHGLTARGVSKSLHPARSLKASTSSATRTPVHTRHLIA